MTPDKPSRNPFHVDLSALTQEQFDRAMQNPGSCSYSGPCILGAMMPDELVATLKDKALDTSSVTRLENLGYVSFEDAKALNKARSVQQAFDWFNSNPLHYGNTLQKLLPHIKVGVPT